MIFLLMMLKNIFLQQVILPKEYKQTLTIMWQKIELTMQALDKKLNPISKNILRRQNQLELVFQDISTFDAENPIVGSLWKQLDVGKKNITSELMKKAPRPPGVDFAIRKRLEKLKNRPEPKDDNANFNLLLPPSPPWPPY